MTACPGQRPKLFSTATPVFAAVAGISASGLTFTAPQGWRATQPESSMRVAQSMLPRAAGDTEDGQLVLYYFGDEGGSVAQRAAEDGREVGSGI